MQKLFYCQVNYKHYIRHIEFYDFSVLLWSTSGATFTDQTLKTVLLK